MAVSLTFLEVDKEDEKTVSEKFPDATILDGVLEGEQLIEACKGASVVSCFVHTQFTKEVVEQLSDVKLICSRSVGYNHIDLEACAKNDITVCHVPDYGSHVIAEHVFALLLATVRHISEGDARVESGEFDYKGLRGVSLRGKTLGIVGTGKIGRRVAQIAHGFGMNILAVDMCRVTELQDLLGVEYVELDDLLYRSDVITLHVPALDATKHMINKASIEKMKEGVILCNTARGELIESAALLDALNSGKVQHALLDVMEHERNFEENKALINHESVVPTPPIAFYAEESMRNMYEDCFLSIDQFNSGKQPDHIVHPVVEVCDMPGVQS